MGAKYEKLVSPVQLQATSFVGISDLYKDIPIVLF